MTRDAHLKWAKERALRKLENNPANALASIITDLQAHDELDNHPNLIELRKSLAGADINHHGKVKAIIDGFV